MLSAFLHIKVNKISRFNSQGGGGEKKKPYFYNLMAFTFRQFFCIFVQTTGEINITALLKLGEPGGPTALCTLFDEKLAPNTREQQQSLYHQDKYRRHVERAFLYQEEAKKDDLSFTQWLQGWNANFATE